MLEFDLDLNLVFNSIVHSANIQNLLEGSNLF